MRKTTHAMLILVLFVAMNTAVLAQGTSADIRAYFKVDDHLSTSGQINYDEIAMIKKEGFDLVINLAPADESRNGQEGFLVAQQGMSYVQIPVNWRNPTQRDLKLFFSIMDANRERKTLVHCFANMRASAFVYLYRTLKQGIDKKEAATAMHAIWDPMSDDRHAQWVDFIKAAEGEYGGQAK